MTSLLRGEKARLEVTLHGIMVAHNLDKARCGGDMAVVTTSSSFSRAVETSQSEQQARQRQSPSLPATTPLAPVEPPIHFSQVLDPFSGLSRRQRSDARTTLYGVTTPRSTTRLGYSAT